MKRKIRKVKKDLRNELDILEKSIIVIKKTKIPYSKIFIYINELKSLAAHIRLMLDEDFSENRHARKLFSDLTKKLDKFNKTREEINNFLLLNKNVILDVSFFFTFDNVSNSIYRLMEISYKFSLELINQYHKKTSKGRITL